MRALLLNYEFPPAGGGAGFATLNIGRQLARMGVEVDILTARIEGEPGVSHRDGMRILRVPSWRKSAHDCGLIGAYSYVAFAALRQFGLLLDRGYDVQHYFFGLPTGLLSQIHPPFAAAPYIISLRGSDVPGYDPFNRTVEKMHGTMLPLTRRIWGRAAAVVALSDGLRRIAAKTAPELDIKVISNGIDPDGFSPPARRADPTGRPLKIITVARLLERKGIHHLFEAVAGPAKLPVEIEVVGTGPYEDALKRRATALGLDDRVRFRGFVRSEALPALYRRADLFALPSQTESFGLVFAEAMACGLPILATTVGGIPELVREGTDGYLVEHACPEQVRAALQKVLADPASVARMGDAARQRILDRFTWEAVAARYLDLYRDITRQSAPAPGDTLQTAG